MTEYVYRRLRARYPDAWLVRFFPRSVAALLRQRGFSKTQITAALESGTIPQHP